MKSNKSNKPLKKEKENKLNKSKRQLDGCHLKEARVKKKKA